MLTESSYSWSRIALFIIIILLSAVTILAVDVDIATNGDVLSEEEVTHAERLLFESSEAGDILGIKKALRLGADMNAQNPKGWTALMFAADKGRIKAINYLAENGADLDMQEDDGWTALFFAAFHGNKKAVERLIFYGADATKEDNKRIYAHATAGVKGHQELSDYISNVGLKQAEERTDLHPLVKAYWTMLGSARTADLHKDDYGPPYDEEFVKKRRATKYTYL